MCNKKYKCKI